MTTGPSNTVVASDRHGAESAAGKVTIGMSMSLDGIASGTTEADFWAVHEAVLGWVFNLRSWRSAQGMEGGEDNADSKLWAAADRRGTQRDSPPPPRGDCRTTCHGTRGRRRPPE